MTESQIHPVILSGGAGTRLWPLSRELYPKQLLPLLGKESLLQMTVERTAGSDGMAPPLLVCNEEHRFLVAEQLRSIDITPRRIVLEPVGRNTAPAAAAAAMLALRDDAEALMLIMPSDHVIADRSRFVEAVGQAAVAARDGALVTFGIEPTGPESGYGYIKGGASLQTAPGCFKVERFVEKPNRDAAESMLADGGWSWNSGIFLFHAATYLAELEAREAEMVGAVRQALDGGDADSDFLRLGKEAFAACPSESIDYAVMEHTERAAVVPVSLGWSDVGSWSALWELGDKDADGNVKQGTAIIEDSRGCLVRGGDRLVALLGLDDVVVVDTDDAVLVARKDKVQDVRSIVERLKREGSQLPVAHTKVYRPWGWYKGIGVGDNFQVKEIQVKPGAKLSLQRHQHRAEHWVVVEGKGRVTRDDEVFDLAVNDATFIPLRAVHRLENNDAQPLTIIEVQCGDYLGEDDIERFEDIYGRKDS